MADDLSTSRNLSYAVAAPSKTPDIRYVDLTRPDIIDGTKTAIDPGTSARSADEQGNTQRQFNLHIVNLVDYKHATTMSSSPLHGSWPESYTLRETFISSVLKQSLPHNMAAKGFARWDYDLEVGGEKAERQSPKTKRLQLQRWMPSKMKNPSQKEPE